MRPTVEDLFHYNTDIPIQKLLIHYILDFPTYGSEGICTCGRITSKLIF